LGGKIDPETHFCGFGDDVINRRIRSHRACPLDVQVTLGFSAVYSRIRAADNRRKFGWGWQIEKRSKLVYVLSIDVTLADDRDGLSVAVVQRSRSRIQSEIWDIVDFCEIRRCDGDIFVIPGFNCELRAVRVNLSRTSRVAKASCGFVHLPPWEVVEGIDAGNNGLQDSWDLRVIDVGPVGLTAPRILMHFSVEGLADLTGGARKLDDCTAVGDNGDREAVGLKPVRNCLNVLIGGAELLAEFLRRKPFVVIRRGAVLLLAQKRVEGGFLGSKRPSASG
jgi:hypothetical protein